MQKKRVFISSVQSEFAKERQMQFDYLTSDVLLGKFFEPFIFENIPAANYSPAVVFLNEVEQSDIYLGIFGEKYGYEDVEGVSPTEREYDLAVKLHKTRLIYLKNTAKRDEKESRLIQKIEKEVIRKLFSSIDELKGEVYASLIRYLEEKKILRLLPFDAAFNRQATFEDIDERKVKNFAAKARIKRNFPFDENTDYKLVLSHLNLVSGERITNTAILLFAKNPQKFLINSSIKCCQFYGNKIEKPIPSYHIYDGDVFELVDQAVSFVMSRVNARVSGRDKSVLADVELELPLQAVTEAIVNAVCHRDYTSNASVQVMLFKNRLEIWNPGQLPYGLTVEMLKTHHSSLPANPLLARPMYLYGSIEQVGTGTEMIVEKCKEYGLPAPNFEQSEIFKLTFWRNVVETEENNSFGNIAVGGQVGGQAGGQAGDAIEDLLTDRQIEIFNIIKSNPFVSRRELSEQMNVNESAIQKHLDNLKKKGFIEREGKTTGYWKIKNERGLGKYDITF